MRILVVDDDPDIREELSELLKDEGYTVFSASSPVEAKAFERIDYIISDFNLGADESGVDVLTYHKKRGAKTILMSGSDCEAFMTESVDMYIKKPFHIDYLLKAIKEEN